MRSLKVVSLLTLFLLVSVWAFPERRNVNLRGNRVNPNIRSILPSNNVEAYIEDSTKELELNFVAEMNNVSVIVKNQEGIVVYSTVVNAEENSTVFFSLTELSSGNYTLTIQDSETELTGEFSM